MSASAIAVLVVPLALALFGWLVSTSVDRGRHNQANEQSIFRVSSFVFIGFSTLILLCTAFAVSALDDDRPRSAILTMMTVSTCAVLGSLAGIWWYARSLIQLTNDEIIVVTPFKKNGAV